MPGVPLAAAFIRIRPDSSGFKGETEKAMGSVDGEGAGGKVGKGFSKGLTNAVTGIAIALIAGGIASIKMAADFQQATTLLVTGAGESEKSIGLVRQGLLDLAPAVGIGPTALAKAMFMVESAGYHGAAGLIVMKAAAEGAKIGGADATVVANGLTTALTDYHLPASQAALVTSKLVATVAAGKTNMGDLSAALSTILPFASSFHVGLNDITGAMATMTGEGIDAATSATMLKFTMMSMANETPKGITALKSIGMTAQQLKDGLSTRGVGGELQFVTDMVGKKFPAGSVEATKAIAAIVGGTRGMGADLALTGTHAATLKGNIHDIATAATEADGSVKGWKTTQEDFNVKLDQAKAAASVLGIKIGNDLLPAVTKVMDFINTTGVPALTNMATWVKQNSAWVGPLAVGIVAVAAAIRVWNVVQAILDAELLANPIGIVVVLLVGLVAGLIYAYKTSQTFRDIVNGVFHGIQVVIGNVVQAIILFFKGMFDVVMWVIGGIVHVASLIPGPWQGAMKQADQAVQGFKAGVDKKMGDMAAAAGGWGQQTGSNYASGLSARGQAVNAVAASVAGNVKYQLSINAYSLGQAVVSSYAGGIQGNSALAIMAAQSVAGQAQAAMAAGLAPHRALGGPVLAGHAYTVGEIGQETFVPSQNGYIVPHGGAAGGGGNGDVVERINALIGVIQGLPKTYQMGARQYA